MTDEQIADRVSELFASATSDTIDDVMEEALKIVQKTTRPVRDMEGLMMLWQLWREGEPLPDVDSSAQ